MLVLLVVWGKVPLDIRVLNALCHNDAGVPAIGVAEHSRHHVLS